MDPRDQLTTHIRSCVQCKEVYSVTAEDLALLEKLSLRIEGLTLPLPEPTRCPSCRHQRRLAMRPERSLYRRSSSSNGSSIISLYTEDRPFPVYDSAAWWSDRWDPLAYARQFDPSRTFFSQFAELMNLVPRQSLFVDNCENCEFNNDIHDSKNCYLCFTAFSCRDCYHSLCFGNSVDTTDSLFSVELEICSNIIDSEHCYNCAYIIDTKTARDSMFLLDCKSCRNCFCCVGLRQKEFCMFNEQLTREEYQAKLALLPFHSRRGLQELRTRFAEFSLQFPRKALTTHQCENCVGDCVNRSSNCHDFFDIQNATGVRHSIAGGFIEDLMDTCFCSESSLGYESHNVANAQGFIGCSACRQGSNLLYCDSCFNCKNCFGCIGLRNKEFCILNRQCTQQEYYNEASRIFRHMVETREWGEFFPLSLMPFAYQDSAAQSYRPLNAEEVLSLGAVARNMLCSPPDIPRDSSTQASLTLPDSIRETDVDIVGKIFHCRNDAKPYRITKGEFELHKKLDLALPDECPECRHKHRSQLRNPKRLWMRKCSDCDQQIDTSYEPSRAERVVCESCYAIAIQRLN